MTARRKSPKEKIAAWKEQARVINARVQREQAKLRESERKADTRRKIIAGALALEHKDRDFRAVLDRLIDENVSREQDRALFGLPPLPDKKKLG